jgi:tetratricopeptide (TPR) repeat protein
MSSRLLVLGVFSTGLILGGPLPALAQHSHEHGSAPAASVPLYDNLGEWSHSITTANPQAQKYFDQGLRLCYGFNHEEATRAFREAARLDPQCAMAWWGVAIAAGPNFNMPMDPDHAKIAGEAIAKAKELASHASDAERAYISALDTRYSDDPARSRAGLDSAYANAMRDLARRFPKDMDAQVLFAESMMDLNPWNQWTHDGQANPGTLELVGVLEQVLKQTPGHPGANHYYIHAVEASNSPERANLAAKRLESLVPGAGHLVHMPSHIYARTGRYEDSRAVNRRAVEVDEKYIAEQNPPGMYPMMYYPHNIQFIWFSACMEGRSTEALEAARKVTTKLPLEMALQMPMVEFVPPLPQLTLARFSRWSEVLSEPAPDSRLHYSTALHHYARGLALAATGKTGEAHAELDSVRTAAAAIPAGQMVSFNDGGQLLRVGIAALEGEIAMHEKRTDDGLSALRAAVATEDSLHYDEPPTWPYPTRHQLGAALLEAGKAKEAEAVYRDDLKRHPENGWSLFGLAKALRGQNLAKQAAPVEARFTKAWSRADVSLTASN